MRLLGRLRDSVEARPRRALLFVALLFVFGSWAWDAREAIAQTAGVYGRGILRVMGMGSRYPSGVSEIDFRTGLTTYRDGGILVVESTGGGGSGNIQTPDGGVASRTIMVADNDGGTVLASTAVSIDPSGNITQPSGGTLNGRDIVADGVEQDSYPLDPMPSSMMSPGDAGFIQGVYQGSTYITNGDAGYTVPACTILVPLRSSCTVRVRWQAAIVSGIDAGAAVSGGGAFCRVYSFYVGATGISAAPNSVACQTDWTGVTAGVTAQYDGSVFQPTFQGPAATNLRLDCFVDDIVCAYNP